MSPTNFEKSVKGATKSKNAAPKSKYIEHILTATYSDAALAEIFRVLQLRLRDSTWTIVFKSLIVIHMMIREGSPGAALSYMSQNPQKLAITSITEVQIQGANIWRYSEYLVARSLAFSETKTDYVRNGQGRLKRLTIAKGLLRETEIVQKQIRALLQCDLLSDEPENEITLTAFRLLTLDLLTLFSVMNEGTINVLEHYFELSRPDSERALHIYKTFSALTEDVVKFLRVARQYEHATRLEIPNLKHASTDLAKLLEDDLNDPDFELRRKEYRAQKYGKREDAKDNATEKASSASKPAATTSAPTQQSQSKPDIKGPTPDLIDFFESIEQNQHPMVQQAPNPVQQNSFPNPQSQNFQQPGLPSQQMPIFQQQAQQPGFQQSMSTGFIGQQPVMGAQGNNPFGQPQPLQPNHTGTGFGGYTPQPNVHGFQSALTPIPQDGVATFQRPVQTGPARANNPFRQSMLPPSDKVSPTPPSFSTAPPTPLQRQNTNPFAKHTSPPTASFSGGPTVFSSQRPQSQGNLQPIQPQRTGTNPFARNSIAPGQLQPPATAPLRPNLTGSTNPFRQSAFISQQSGQGWQNGVPQGTIGGLENLETVPVFPRPGQTA
ncbi:hypothetical protein VTO42DRAFT_5739 [Malbranchea cinnamomea]